MKISALIITKNEEANIERCLRSLDFCDEVIVIDDLSQDTTLKKVQKIYKVYKVFQRKLNGDFSGQRNFAMEKAKNEWILFLDADEEISKELKEEINSVDYRQPIGALYLKRRDFFWSRELKFGETAKIRNYGIIRLIKKNSGRWEGKVHEEYKVKSSKLKVQSLQNYINHYPHQTVKKFLEEVNFYSTLRARELQSQGKKTNILEIIFFPLGKFLITYFIKLGFLDGPAGFVYAFFMSFHSFLVRAKLYQYTKINKLSS